MRIGIDARPATEIKAGIGTYVRELLREFSTANEHELLLYARKPWAGAPEGQGFRWRIVSGGDVGWNLRVALLASRECDVYLSTASYLTPWFMWIPTVVVVHDMIAFDSARLPNQRFARIERATIAPSLRRCRAVITISNSTRRDLVDRFPKVDTKTHVIHDAAQEHFRADGEDDTQIVNNHGIEREFVLAVGTLEPRKNLPRLIEAFAGLPPELRSRYELVLVGATGWGTTETFAAVRTHSSFVRALGYVDDEALPALYRKATLFAFPSIYEGFGLPVLEAMRCGTAVLAARSSSIPEVGGDAVQYVDPFSVDAIRSGLEDLLSNPDQRDRLSQSGLKRSGQFTWGATASATMRVIEAAAGASARSSACDSKLHQ